MLTAQCSKIGVEDIPYIFLEVDHKSEIVEPDNEEIEIVFSHIKKANTDYSSIEKRLGHDVPNDFKQLLKEQGFFNFSDIFYLVDASDSEDYYTSYLESIKLIEFGQDEEEMKYTYYHSFVIGMSSLHDFCHILICYKQDGTPYLVYSDDGNRISKGLFTMEKLEEFLVENFEHAISRFV